MIKHSTIRPFVHVVCELCIERFFEKSIAFYIFESCLVVLECLMSSGSRSTKSSLFFIIGPVDDLLSVRTIL